MSQTNYDRDDDHDTLTMEQYWAARGGKPKKEEKSPKSDEKD